MQEFQSIAAKEDHVMKEMVNLFQKYDLTYDEAEKIMLRTTGYLKEQKVQFVV